MGSNVFANNKKIFHCVFISVPCGCCGVSNAYGPLPQPPSRRSLSILLVYRPCHLSYDLGPKNKYFLFVPTVISRRSFYYLPHVPLITIARGFNLCFLFFYSINDLQRQTLQVKPTKEGKLQLNVFNFGHKQCDQIGRFIGRWATFQSLWRQLICPNISHF